MKAFELFTESQKVAGVWGCGGCRRIHANEGRAKDCCVCIDCKTEPRVEHRLRCEACGVKFTEKQNAEQKEKERVAMEKAEIVDGEFGLFYGDTYLKNVEDAEAELEIDDVAPEFCFAAKPVKFREWSLNDIMDSEDEQYGLEESGEIMFAGLDALRKAFDDFNATNDGLNMCYMVDYTKKVKVGSTE